MPPGRRGSSYQGAQKRSKGLFRACDPIALAASLVLLSDPEGSNAQAFGVANSSSTYAQRWTFYVDKSGVVRAIDTDVSTDTAGQDIARKLGELGFPKKR